MASIFTNAQIPQHSLIRFAGCLVISLFTLYCAAQSEYNTRSKKAIKYFEKASESIRKRNFPGGILLYKKAIKKDPGFSEAFYRLGSAFTVLREMDSAYHYFNQYREVTPAQLINYRNAFFLAGLYFQRGEYEKAREVMDIGKRKNTQWNSDRGKSVLNDRVMFALNGKRSPVSYIIEELPPEVNRFYTQYFPAITIDGNYLFFTRRGGSSNMHDEDIVVSRREGGVWQPAVSVSSVINSQFNEGACSISADGRILIFTSCEEQNSFGSCDLYISNREGDKWSKPVNLGNTLNSIYWDSQPSLSADGRSIYFSSNRPGGHGQRDIWVSELGQNGWGIPKNLGRNINSAGDETTPYIHSNNQTLFFSSNGHLGYGGYDLFVADKEGDSIFSKPANLGYGLNDHHDQLSLIISGDGKGGYFALEKTNAEGYISSKLAHITFEEDTLVKRRASYVTGKVLDAVSREPVGAKIELYDLETSSVQYRTNSDPVLGDYFFVLTERTEYGAFVSAKNYLFEDFRFEVSENSLLDPDTINILLHPIGQGASMVLENIYFEFDSYELVPTSIAELNVISQFLKENSVKVEISGHTDEIGSDSYNQRLSTNRAKAVYDYLIEAGVDPAQLVHRGYGAFRPRFAEESQKSKNRRIEFEILEVNP